MATPDPEALFSELNHAVAASGLDQYILHDEPPTVVLGPGDDVEIVYDVNPEALPGWERLSFIPTEDEPPRWSARIFSVTADDQLSSHEDADGTGPSHDTVDGAATALADQLIKQAEKKRHH